MILPNPIYLYAGAAALVIGAVSGYKVRDWQCDAAVAKALERAEEQRQEMQDEVDQASRDYETLRAETYGMGTRTTREVHTIYQDVPAPPADCAPPISIVGLLEGSVSSANANASGKPRKPVPGPTASTAPTARPSEGDLGN